MQFYKHSCPDAGYGRLRPQFLKSTYIDQDYKKEEIPRVCTAFLPFICSGAFCVGGGLRFRRRKHYLVLIYKMIVFKQILDYRSLKFIKGSMEGQLVNYWKLHFCKFFSIQQL